MVEGMLALDKKSAFFEVEFVVVETRFRNKIVNSSPYSVAAEPIKWGVYSRVFCPATMSCHLSLFKKDSRRKF